MAAADEDHRTRLEALRDRLAGAIETASDRDLAPLSARYESVLEKLAALPNANAEADDVEAAQAETEAVLRLVQ